MSREPEELRAHPSTEKYKNRLCRKSPGRPLQLLRYFSVWGSGGIVFDKVDGNQFSHGI